MREIRFRAWDNKDEVKEVICWECIIDDGFEKYLQDENVVLMQFTGLHDKNGKEIYEGDIVKYYINTGFYTGRDDPAEIDERTEYTEAVYWLDEITGFNPLCGTPYEEIEVIGNIYENPEVHIRRKR